MLKYLKSNVVPSLHLPKLDVAGKYLSLKNVIRYAASMKHETEIHRYFLGYIYRINVLKRSLFRLKLNEKSFSKT